MRRISTFSMFEAEQGATDLMALCDALNKSTKALGCHFDPDPRNQLGLSSYNSPLRKGHSVDAGIKRMTQPEFRSLMLSVFYGIQETDQPGWVLTCYDTGVRATNSTVFEWVSVNYSSDRFDYEQGMSFRNGHRITVAPSVGLSANVAAVMMYIKEMIAGVGFLQCKASGAISNAIDLDFEALVPALVPALASYALGEPEGIKLICDAVREAGESRSALIGRIRGTSPALWQDLMPVLGTGAEQHSTLGDLGF